MDSAQLILLAVLGLCAGTYGAIIGAGGGFILVPILLFLPFTQSLSPQAITAITLTAACANAISGSIAYLSQRRVDVSLALIFALCALPGSIAGRVVVAAVERQRFNVAFGMLLAFLGLYLLFRKPPVAKPHAGGPVPFGHLVRRYDQDGAPVDVAIDIRLGALLSFGIGLAASVFGIGGGVLFVPLAVGLLGLPIRNATATSQLFLLCTSLVAITTDVVRTNGSLFDRLDLLVPIVAGTVVGGQLGAALAKRIQVRLILQLLAAGLVLIGARLVSTGFSGG